MDVDTLELGQDFREALKKRLASCDMMLVLIGRDWLEVRDKAGQRRLDQPDDFVRQEVATALKRDITVTPVLVQGAAMPRAEQLPEDLKDLAFRQGFELRYTQWQSDIAEMNRRLGLKAGPAPPSGGRRRVLTLGGAAVAAGLVVAGYLLYRPQPAPPGPTPAPAPAPSPSNTGGFGGSRPFAVLLSSDSTIGTGGAKDELARAQAFAQDNLRGSQAAVLLRNNYFATALLFEAHGAAIEALPRLQQHRWKDAYVAELREWCRAGAGRALDAREGIAFTNCMP